MKRDVLIYIKDIIDNMNHAEDFVKGMNYRDFVKEERTNYAVLRCIEIMGEAAKHVPEAIRKKYPDIPWKDIAGMRDKVIHFYFGVHLERVWKVITDDIPQIKPLLERSLKKMRTGR